MAVDIKHLSVAFQTAQQVITAVDDISFNLLPGETLVLLGESGCGKSLTSLALMRLLPSFSAYGNQSQILVDGEDLLNLSEKKMQSYRGRRLAMIFQEPMTALNPVLTIGEQLAEAIRQHHTLSRAKVMSRMMELLSEVELPQPHKRLSQYPHQLSGGQKQRVVIAMALACNPEILIADEPTTALDVTIQAQILALLKKIQRQYQMSLLLITHDLGVVNVMADRVCVMYAGQIVEVATAEDFFAQPLHPYAQQLLVSLPSYAKRGEQLKAIAGQVPSLDAMPSGCRFHPRCAHAFSICPHVVPLLQSSRDERYVRCHLYPEHLFPPPLTLTQDLWAIERKEEECLLRVEQVSVYFSQPSEGWPWKKEHFKAVDQLSFTVKKGHTLALVGESGCGKTTIARTLMRLIPTTSGSIIFQGKEVTLMKSTSLQEYRKKVQIIFQDPYSSMNPRMTVGEILAEGMSVQGFSRKDIEKKKCRLLEQVQLSQSSLERYPHQFSGGQRQRICIARALATEPELLICDEPTSALDISVQAQILNLLKSLQYEYGLSYLFITHNMGVVSYLADDVLVMRAGQEVEYGTCEQILYHPAHPYTRQLLESVPKV